MQSNGDSEADGADDKDDSRSSFDESFELPAGPGGVPIVYSPIASPLTSPLASPGNSPATQRRGIPSAALGPGTPLHGPAGAAALDWMGERLAADGERVAEQLDSAYTTFQQPPPSPIPSPLLRRRAVYTQSPRVSSEGTLRKAGGRKDTSGDDVSSHAQQQQWQQQWQARQMQQQLPQPPPQQPAAFGLPQAQPGYNWLQQAQHYYAQPQAWYGANQ